MRQACVLSLIFLIGSSAFAALEEARTVEDADSLYLTPVQPAPDPSPQAEGEEKPVVDDDPVVLNRPWLMETAVGSTAFVLDQGQFQFTPLDMRLVTFDGLLPAAAWVHFGVTDFLTLGVGPGIDLGTGAAYFGTPEVNGWPMVAEARLNFLNVGRWSFSLAVAGRYQFGFDSSAWQGRRSSSALVELMASEVTSARVRLHFHFLNGFAFNEIVHRSYSFSGRWNAETQRYEEGAPELQNYGQDQAVFRTRFGGALEWRPAREHVFLFGITAHGSVVYGSSYVYDDLVGDFSPRGSFGYHFVSQNRFTLYAGLELGPSFRVYDRFGYSTYYGNSVGIGGALSAGINFVL